MLSVREMRDGDREVREKKENEKKKKKNPPQCTSGSKTSLSEKKQPSCALRVHYFVVGFYAYSE